MIKEEEQLLFEREISRHIDDLNRWTDPSLKEIIRQEVLFLCSIMAKTIELKK
ncbi:hypothetical protein [Sporosarcina globispora]|uniref:hypothetical protein n=1 Tax=Sporosarcina globispora TaxID=1459 RepID=UPI000A6C016F|nr:hypothetical protein [Sporosarcina globispora]